MDGETRRGRIFGGNLTTFREVNVSFGETDSWRTWEVNGLRPRQHSFTPLRYPLDHLFHSEHMTLIDFRRLPYTGSDHFPIYAALQLTPEAAAIQEQDPPSRTDEKEADKVIARAETE